MGVRGIRGATTVEQNISEQMLKATKELVETMILRNRLQPDHVAAVFITVTRDLDADFPAKAVRMIPGWEMVPLMCSNEIPVPGSMERCIRIMMLVNTDLNLDEVNHVFLGNAAKLRPDLANKMSS